jgi:hypothetical protein
VRQIGQQICFSDRGSNQSGGLECSVSDLVQETELLPVWETEVHPDDGGWDTSLAKREC